MRVARRAMIAERASRCGQLGTYDLAKSSDPDLDQLESIVGILDPGMGDKRA